MTKKHLLAELTRIANALERMSPPAPDLPDFAECDAFQWNGDCKTLLGVQKPARLPLDLLQSIERSKKTLLANTLAFAKGLSANNALLWGARGTGKSSLIKAVHGELAKNFPRLKLIEIKKDDIADLPHLMALLKGSKDFRFIIFCDDLSFEGREDSYKALKVALDGGIAGRPENSLFYATSNRRHLLPRDMIENEMATAINPGDAVEESVSLSDRFGLWLGFHRHGQDDYFAMIEAYIAHFELKTSREEWLPKAIEWSRTRGDQSGRVAWQFFQHLAAEKGHTIKA